MTPDQRKAIKLLRLKKVQEISSHIAIRDTVEDEGIIALCTAVLELADDPNLTDPDAIAYVAAFEEAMGKPINEKQKLSIDLKFRNLKEQGIFQAPFPNPNAHP